MMDTNSGPIESIVQGMDSISGEITVVKIEITATANPVLLHKLGEFKLIVVDLEGSEWDVMDECDEDEVMGDSSHKMD
ncbi:hypothetical protein LEL_11016 [Akanthomyces lecanii RCEF 1005]|uniref:Uncharacterized protein n=1 Tax=Akanthomyces lecanii RCEF 1005 TaxID=1081108 RepID=A0A167LZZ8_CORDF|nr:hypothetical protein LEL_11016 [Akanthomyces lecanii RCEF 1005]